jgi:hypothetical protein
MFVVIFFVLGTVKDIICKKYDILKPSTTVSRDGLKNISNSSTTDLSKFLVGFTARFVFNLCLKIKELVISVE